MFYELQRKQPIQNRTKMSSSESEEIDLGSLSKKHAAGLLVFAWNYFHCPKATSVQITAINNNQIGLKIFLKRKETKDVVYTFTSEEKTKSNLNERIALLVKRNSTPGFPPMGVVSLIAWFVIFVMLAPQAAAIGLFVAIKSFLMKFLSEQAAWYMCYFVVGSHALESIYVLFTITPVVNSLTTSLAWFGVDFIFGYPTTQQVILLSKIHKESLQADKAK